MEKAILISINARHIAKIFNGEKNLEIRKTEAKCKLPIPCFIYCTRDEDIAKICRIGKDRYVREKAFDVNDFNMLHSGYSAKGKVVGMFMLNKITNIECLTNGDVIEYVFNDITPSSNKYACLSYDALHKYLKGKNGFAWHIEDLVIFDKPMELSELYACKLGWNNCVPHNCNKCPCKYNLTKAPQSWCYVCNIKK